MYDCAGPQLVLATPTYHPVLSTHTGYIFAYYEFHFHRPQELFFAHIFEAQLFALYRGAEMHLDAGAAPQVVTALDYIISAPEYDDSRFLDSPSRLPGSGDTRPTSRKPANTFGPPPEDDIPEVDWFGD